jgi:hypothetical protein
MPPPDLNVCHRMVTRFSENGRSFRKCSNHWNSACKINPETGATHFLTGHQASSARSRLGLFRD